MELREPESHGTVVDEKTFALVTELEIQKAVRLQYYVSLLAIDLIVESAEATDALKSLAEQVATVISEQLRGTDLVGVGVASPMLQVLLVNAHLDSLALIIQRVTEEVSRHVFQVDGDARTVQLCVGGSCFPTTAATREELVSQARSIVERERSRRDTPAASNSGAEP
jgi:hypothetical protein